MTALGSVVVQAVVLLTGLVVVQGDTQVGCVFGGSCVLPCRFQPNSDTILHWIKMNGKNVQVHSYYDDQDQLGHQDPLYKGRTSLFHDQISGGDASLGLARVNLQDQGRYLCYASTSQYNQETFVTLTVRGELKSLRHCGEQHGKNQTIPGQRTSLFNDQISGGNTSLSLARVNLQDQGRYLCYASTLKNNQETFVTLTVRGEEEWPCNRILSSSPDHVIVPMK
ncbi:butyrophilin subfamily 1 member A1-like [Gadus morhua]|uniref:butyrophilin subfamily 1 member A1-like n=1 Tax=Gadus morhua TaxID=8049 RepID=UPI0011B3BD88|nr:butyrophilin subfamily 1 member A1-like [Gadus morhua]